MKLKKEFEETDNSTVYRRARWQHVVEQGKSICKCSHCGPHKGCNCRQGWYASRSWKMHRRTQYKPVDIEYGLYVPHEMEYLLEEGFSRDLIEMLEGCPPVEDILERLRGKEIGDMEV